MRGWRVFAGQLIDFLEKIEARARLVAREFLVGYTLGADVHNDLALAAPFWGDLDLVSVTRLHADDQRKPACRGIDICGSPERDNRVIRLNFEQDAVAAQCILG